MTSVSLLTANINISPIFFEEEEKDCIAFIKSTFKDALNARAHAYWITASESNQRSFTDWISKENKQADERYKLTELIPSVWAKVKLISEKQLLISKDAKVIKNEEKSQMVAKELMLEAMFKDEKFHNDRVFTGRQLQVLTSLNL
jgi:hypothetical protein